VFAVDDFLCVPGAVQDGANALVLDAFRLAPLPQELHIFALRAWLDVRKLLGRVPGLKGRTEKAKTN
jgi:hypothetical protein